MATKVLMEALSPTMEEGRLVEWKKNEGDAVASGEVLAEVETDKAVMELVARSEGTLLKQLAGSGTTVPVGSVIGWIGAKGETVPDGQPQAAEAGGRAGGQAGGETAAPAPKPPAPKTAPSKEEPPARPTTEGRVKASPLARKLASEGGLDIGTITGTGPEGRVVKRDVEAAAAAPRVPAAGPSARPPARPPAQGEFEDIPLTQIRKTIARRLVQSIGPIPTFYLTTEVDMERAAEARDALKAALGEAGKVSFNDIVLKAVASALAQHPECNAWWQDDHIRQWYAVHLGMAVATPDGLITPVIRNADRKSMREINAEAREMAERARARKLKPEEYTGATFTVSNLGMFDIDEFTAVINPPEAGILAVGRLVETPVAMGGQVQVRRRMRLTMSCDHRVIDGATGAQFLKTLKLMLENPLALVF
ncbi:MAG TPA: dihydrolipoamide acetyltransferase family protein [Gemmatimonadales bacterium]|nr:dihydrolipoamide acetyltransferase family protein [Gemmatimonadales bacterium]